MSKKVIFSLLSFLFVIFSFSPSLYEIYSRNKLPAEREFVLEHNYMFDFNFYLSRIRQGQEGRWLVVEKYYNEPHNGSLLQIFYLYLGKVGGIFRLSPTIIYHLSRLIVGFIFLILIASYTRRLFDLKWSIIAFLLVVTAGSFPVLVWGNGFPRFATYMGWWSAIDSLQRISFIPHILLGQIGLLLIIFRFGENKLFKWLKLLMWGIVGFVVGIIFPPTLIVLYVIFIVLSLLELTWQKRKEERILFFKDWLEEKGISRLVFILFSIPSLVYLQLIVRIPPWSALPLFDIQHRFLLPYKEYFLALGPMLPLGLLGLLLVLYKRELKFYPMIAWVLSIFALFRLFENFPQQSPLRFTEAAIHIPLGILAGYFFQYLLEKLGKHGRWGKRILWGMMGFVIIMGLGVMVSMMGWLTDQAYSKRLGGWQVPIGAQLVYPLKDFMEGIYYLRDHTNKSAVILGYITAGNYIPAYAGNFVYLGHANTPDEDGKEKIAAKFFRGEMSLIEGSNFLITNRISYIFFGPQEKELGGIDDIMRVYPFLQSLHFNSRVNIYKVNLN